MGLLEVQQFAEEYLGKVLREMFQNIEVRGRVSVNKLREDLVVDKSGLIKSTGKDTASRYEIYFDNEFITSFTEDEPVKLVEKSFLQGFLDLYQSQRIFLNQELYEERNKQAKLDEMVRNEKIKIDRENALKQSRLTAYEKSIAMQTLIDSDKGGKNAPAK